MWNFPWDAKTFLPKGPRHLHANKWIFLGSGLFVAKPCPPPKWAHINCAQRLWGNLNGGCTAQHHLYITQVHAFKCPPRCFQQIWPKITVCSLKLEPASTKSVKCRSIWKDCLVKFKKIFHYLFNVITPLLGATNAGIWKFLLFYWNCLFGLGLQDFLFHSLGTLGYIWPYLRHVPCQSCTDFLGTSRHCWGHNPTLHVHHFCNHINTLLGESDLNISTAILWPITWDFTVDGSTAWCALPMHYKMGCPNSAWAQKFKSPLQVGPSFGNKLHITPQ